MILLSMRGVQEYANDEFLAESYLEFNAQDLEFGFNESRRDRILRTFVRNAYYYHLNEIYSTLKNEYTDWDKPLQNPLSVRDATLEVCNCSNMLIIAFGSLWLGWNMHVFCSGCCNVN